MLVPFILAFLLVLGASSTDTSTPAATPVVTPTEKPEVVQEYVQEPAKVIPTPTVDPTQDRIHAIASQVGVTVPIAIGECVQHPGALACFNSVSNTISVTQAGLESSDDFLRCIITHENRHAYQKAAGLITYAPNGYISNREWLEQDAHNFAGCG